MNIKRLQWQKNVWEDKHRYLVINCGRRAGKSTIASIKILHFASENKKSIVWFVAPTYKQAKSIMWQMLIELIPQQAIVKTNETELKIILKNGSQILLKGADSPDSLRGVRIDFCVFDECAFIDRWSEVWKVMRPTLLDSKADVWMISTPNGLNHFKDMAEKKDKDWSYHHYTTYDNIYLDKKEIDKAKIEMDEDSFAQEMMGEFRKMTGLIYKNFDRKIHMVDVPYFDHNWSFFRSLDFGFVHKTALGYFAVHPTGTEMYMYDGLYQSGLTTKDLAEAIKIKDGGRFFLRSVADSAQPMNIEELAREGVRFNPVEKGRDSVKNGITKVSELLKIRKDTGKPTLMFAKRLSWAADELERYRWMERKAGGYIKEAPLKREDDFCFVGGTKILTSTGEKNIEDISEQDKIVTPFGLAKTAGSYLVGKKRVVNYGVFKATSSHKILTNRGIVRLDSLRYTDYICQKQFTFKECLIGAILNQKIELIEFIFNGLLTRNLEVKLGFYIGKFGNTIMAKFLKEGIYIILMGILQIIKYLILSVLLVVSMLKNIIGGVGKVIKNIKKRFQTWQGNGEKTIQKKLVGFILSLLKRGGEIGVGKKQLKNVRFVGKSTKHISLLEANTVIKIAKQQRGEEEKVYNLANEHGMYYANGVLVSNCDMLRYFVMGYKPETSTKALPSDNKNWSIGD